MPSRSSTFVLTPVLTPTSSDEPVQRRCQRHEVPAVHGSSCTSQRQWLPHLPDVTVLCVDVFNRHGGASKNHWWSRDHCRWGGSHHFRGRPHPSVKELKLRGRVPFKDIGVFHMDRVEQLSCEDGGEIHRNRQLATSECNNWKGVQWTLGV